MMARPLIMGSILAVAWFWAVPAAELPRGVIIERVPCHEAPDRSYSLYLPSGYTAEREWPLLVVFEPLGRALVPMPAIVDAADRFGFIVACSWDTRNYEEFEKNWDGARLMLNDLLARFTIDGRRIYAGGFSGGARLASKIDTYTRRLAGVVLCGAGLHVPDGPRSRLPELVVMLVGDRDFNFLELLELEDELDSASIANRRVVFDGPHTWPDAAAFDEALGWLQLQAHRKGQIPKGDVQVAGQIERGLARARALEGSGDLVEAARALSNLLEAFPDEPGAARVRGERDRLTSSRGFRKQAKAQSRIERRERRLRDRLAAILVAGENASGDLDTRSNLLLEWSRELSRVRRMTRADRDPRERAMADRVLFGVRAYCYEMPIVYFRNREFEKVIFTSKAALALVPEAGYPHLNLAGAYAQLGRTDAAFDALGGLGEIDAEQLESLREDPRFDPLRDDPRFEQLLRGT